MRAAFWSRVLLLGWLVITGGSWSGVALGQEQAATGQPVGTEERSPKATREPGSVAPASPQFVVHGIIVIDDERSALLEEPLLTFGKIFKVFPGEQVGPYRVSRIEDDGIVLEKDGAFFEAACGGSGRARWSGAVTVADGIEPTWSPDGSRIAFTGTRCGIGLLGVPRAAGVRVL